MALRAASVAAPERPPMRELGETIRNRRRELRLTLDRLAAAVGCHKSYLSQIENGRRDAPPSDDLLHRLERSLRLKPDSLTVKARMESMPVSVREQFERAALDRKAGRRLAALLQSRTLDDLHASGELASLVAQLARDDAAPGSGGGGGACRARDVELIALPTQVPLINQVNAGYPREFTDLGYPARVADEYVSVPGVSDPDAFAARVVGDSMEPEYHPGDIVVFSPERIVHPGMDCFVRYAPGSAVDPAGGSTFKRVYYEGHPEAPAARGEHPHGSAGVPAERIRLQPLNPAYAPTIVPREEIDGLYAAVWVVRPAPRTA